MLRRFWVLETRSKSRNGETVSATRAVSDDSAKLIPKY